LPGIVVLSLGQGMTWTGMWVAAGQGIAATEQGVAAGMASTSQQIGGALGLALLVSLANAATQSSDLAHGIQLAVAASALLALFGAALAWRLRQPSAALLRCAEAG
jgi:sugar phosphate permease